MAKQTLWSAEQAQLLHQLFPLGDAPWIAREINKQTGSGFTDHAVIGKCFRVGLKRERRGRQANQIAPKRKRAKVTRETDQPPTVSVIELFDRYINPNHLGVSFADLQPQDCRFPKGEGFAATYCGQPVVVGQSWCADCMAVVFEKPTRPQYRRAA